MDTLKTFISLLVIVNPIGAIPLFISLTPNQNEDEKRRTIKLASIAVAMVLLVSGFLGEQVIRFFGISIASFQVGGGILVLLVAVSMLNAQVGPARQTREELQEAETKANIAVVPLAIPLMTGPGSVSTVIIYAQKATHWTQYLTIAGSSIAIGLITWGALSLAAPISRVLGQTGINVATRLMGLLLAAIAVEIMADGLGHLFPVLLGK
ncbi:MAG: YchE family NAAT transporter [Formivibrio sp.]|nr:YchE family NAAT transporter [Formivibrio sp.]